MPPLGVLAHEEIVAPCLIANRLGLLGPRDKGFSTVGELLLFALLALTQQLLPSAALTLRLPPIRRFVMAMDELIREGLFGSPSLAGGAE